MAFSGRCSTKCDLRLLHGALLRLRHLLPVADAVAALAKLLRFVAVSPPTTSAKPPPSSPSTSRLSPRHGEDHLVVLGVRPRVAREVREWWREELVEVVVRRGDHGGGGEVAAEEREGEGLEGSPEEHGHRRRLLVGGVGFWGEKDTVVVAGPRCLG